MEKDLAKITIIATHLSQFFAPLIVPLIVFLAVEDKDVKEHSREVLNWAVSQAIYWIISGILAIILVGFVLMFILSVIGLIFSIIGAIKAADGKLYRYPLTIRFF